MGKCAESFDYLLNKARQPLSIQHKFLNIERNGRQIVTAFIYVAAADSGHGHCQQNMGIVESVFQCTAQLANREEQHRRADSLHPGK